MNQSLNLPKVSGYSMTSTRSIAFACLLAASMSGCAQNTPNKSAGQTAAESVRNAIDGMFGKKNGAPSAGTPAPANSAPLTPPSGVAQLPVKLPPLSPAEQLEIKRYRALLAKGTVTGEDLLDTMKALRRDLITERDAQATAKLALALDHSAEVVTKPQGFDWGSLLNIVSDLVKARIKSEVNEFAFKTLDDYLQTLLDNPRLSLAEQKVQVPSPNGLSDAQVKRNVTLAALVMTARLSHEVLKKAEIDFKSLSTDYKTLLQQREDATKLLITAIDLRRAAVQSGSGAGKNAADADLKSGLSEKDLNFIDTTLSRMSLGDFAKDMAAQNLALEYLRAKNPGAFKEYRTLADDVVQRTRGYIRTVSGLAAFGAMSMSFAHEMSVVADEKNLDSILNTTPLALEFVKAAEPLAEKAVVVSVNGVALPTAKSAGSLFSNPLFGPDLFTVSMGKDTRSVSAAKDVFRYFNDVKMSDPFASHLFSTDSDGWLSRIYLCDANQVGQMIDLAVPHDDRARFAKDYFAWTDTSRIEQFSFTNAFELPGKTRREAELAENILKRDQRKRTDSLPLASVQKSIAQNYAAWNTQQLLQLIFHNRESGAAYASLEFDGVIVKPIPSAEAVYAYESRVNSCQKASARAEAPLRDASPRAAEAARPGKRVAGI